MTQLLGCGFVAFLDKQGSLVVEWEKILSGFYELLPASSPLHRGQSRRGMDAMKTMGRESLQGFWPICFLRGKRKTWDLGSQVQVLDRSLASRQSQRAYYSTRGLSWQVAGQRWALWVSERR